MQKRVRCTHCEGPVDVAERAMSVFCPHCHQRLRVEDLRVDRYFAVQELATCGDITVERRGHLVATVKAGTLVVRGRVTGNVRAGARVWLTKTGSLKGDIAAPGLRVESGATLVGNLRIGVPRTGGKIGTAAD